MIKLEIHNQFYRFLKNNSLNPVHDIPSWQDITAYLAWCRNGKLHRLNRPAVIYSSGAKDWYENGKHIKTEYPKK